MLRSSRHDVANGVKESNRMYVAQPITWTDRGVIMLDQRRLPAEEISYTTPTTAKSPKHPRNGHPWRSGHPASAAAMGAALGVLHSPRHPSKLSTLKFTEICGTLAKNPPTAVDLFWALERMRRRLQN